jgi:hypothetical protein
MKKVIVFLLIGMGFWSCEPKCTNDPDLTADEISWFNCYTNGQVFIYKSNTGLYDTNKVVKYIAGGSLPTEDYQCPHVYQKEIVEVGGTEMTVSHYNKYFPQNLNSASIGPYRFSNYTPQNNVVVNGITYNRHLS